MSQHTGNIKFVSKSELDEARKKRQEEWEKVRRPDQPLEAPEEEKVDRRSLFERLQEQKDKKQAEYDETHKLKNQVRGLDNDEADFLEFVNQRQVELEAERLKEEKEALALLQMPVEKPVTSKSTSPADQPSSSQSSKMAVSLGPKKRMQAEILGRLVKRKRSDSDENSDAKKHKEESVGGEDSNSLDSSDAGDDQKDCKTEPELLTTSTSNSDNAVSRKATVARVIGVLPGIGVYSGSSDSDSSSSDSEIDTDVFRRSVKDVEKLVQAAQQH